MDSSLLANLLASYPFKMALQRFVSPQGLQGAECFTQLHLVVLFVDTAVTLAADIDTCVELGFSVVLTKMRAAV